MGGRGYLSNIFSCWPAATAEKTGQSCESCGKRQIEILWRYECLSFFCNVCESSFFFGVAKRVSFDDRHGIPMGCVDHWDPQQGTVGDVVFFSVLSWSDAGSRFCHSLAEEQLKSFISAPPSSLPWINASYGNVKSPSPKKNIPGF